MLKITIPDGELYDSANNEFYNVKGQTLTLEHSLISISKWESKWKKPFLSDKKKTFEETIDYIRCMVVSPSVVDPYLFYNVSNEVVDKIEKYIRDPMTATWFSNNEQRKSGPQSVVTSEVIYYRMIMFGVPVEFEKWHLNRLLTLIRVCDEHNSPKKKMSAREIANRNRALNAQRRAALKTKG